MRSLKLFVAGFVIFSMLLTNYGIAEENASTSKLEKYIKEASDILQTWAKAKEKGVNSLQMRETIHQLRKYRDILEEGLSKQPEIPRKNLQEALTIIARIESEIDWLNCLLNETEKVRKQWQPILNDINPDEKNLTKICEILEMTDSQKEFRIEQLSNTKTKSTVYPTGGWKKTKTSGISGRAKADYDVATKTGYSYAEAIFFCKAWGKSSLYWETWWTNIPLDWHIEYRGEYDGWLALFFDLTTYVAMDCYAHDVYNGILYQKEFLFRSHSTDGSAHIVGTYNQNTGAQLDIQIGTNRWELWRIGVKLEVFAESFLGNTKSDFYHAPLHWTLDEIEISTV